MAMQYEITELKPFVSDIIKRTGKFPTTDEWDEIKITLWTKQIAFLADSYITRKLEQETDNVWKQEYEQKYDWEQFRTLGAPADYAAAVQQGGTSALVSPKGLTKHTLNHALSKVTT